ncbi:MAG: Fe2+-dependent dioxygenase [Luteimonas sp.]
MILCVPNVLGPQELATVRAGLRDAGFADGAETAGWSARGVKKNLQLAPGAPGYEELAKIVSLAFMRNATLMGALFPAATTRVLFNRYGPGMEYGPHVDAPVMGALNNAVRTDVAITIFLNDPASYEGGELVAQVDGYDGEFKLEAGAAVAYPGNTLHHVRAVASGTRDAAILWVQSQVRDPARRALLWDLENAKRQVFGREGKSPTFDAIDRSLANLVRMWAEV